MKFDWTQGALADGLRLYKAGEFFAAHEAWESVWLGSLEPDKTFLQGLIQVTAAFHHLQRDNPRGDYAVIGGCTAPAGALSVRLGGVSVALLCPDIRERRAQRSLLALQFGEGLLVVRLKNRGEAVFAGHRFYDFHASMAWIDLFAGSNHTRSL